MSFRGADIPSVPMTPKRASISSCNPVPGQVSSVGHLHRLARFCAIASCSLIFSFCAVTSAFANEANDRKINTLFFWTLVQLNVQVIVCSDYVSADAASMRQKLKQYWQDKDGVPMPDTIFEETVKEMRAKIEKLTTAEREHGCKEALRETIQNYSMMRKLYLDRKLDKGVPPPSVALDSMGLQ